jgi:hypothetical protein
VQGTGRIVPLSRFLEWMVGKEEPDTPSEVR